MFKQREATIEDFALINLHSKNIEEIKAMSNLSILECLAITYDVSKEKYIAIVDDDPVCLYGITSDNEIWLLFSEDVIKLPLSFFKESIKVVSKYNNLHGRIYYKNDFALQWAKFLGFIIKDPKPFGINNELFYEFYKGDN